MRISNQKIPRGIELNRSLKNMVTTRVGGAASFFLKIKNENKLKEAIEWANKNKIDWIVLGEGSNLIPNDKGFNGLIIKNEIIDFKIKGNKVFVGSGNNLLKFILKLNKFGLTGMEKMAGIPGTVGGGLRGSVGAYGQEIKDTVIRIKFYDVSVLIPQIRWFSKEQCRFDYRESIFKRHKNWIILGAEFEFKKKDSKKLLKTSKDIIKIREQKYPPDLLCPGSFFKNIVIRKIKPVSLRKKLLEKIPENKTIYGKIPAGYLLDVVGARGMRRGNIKIADYHGNLIYNIGDGKSSDILALSKILKKKVRNKFGINLEEEIQYL